MKINAGSCRSIIVVIVRPQQNRMPTSFVIVGYRQIAAKMRDEVDLKAGNVTMSAA
jgi:hypothetical protein